MQSIGRIMCCLCAGLLALVAAAAAELVTLSPDNYQAYAPGGMEGEAFVGDYLLRNEIITVVVADPDLISGRSASRWGRPNVAGTIIDLARRDGRGDQLTAYYPGPFRFKPDAPQAQGDFIDEALASKAPDRRPSAGQRVTLALPAYEAASGRMLKELAALPPSLRGKPQPAVEVRYTLEDGWPYVLVELTYTNPTEKAFQPNLSAVFQVDHGGETGIALDGRLFWQYDRWWGQAFGVLTEDHRLAVTGRSGARVTLGYVTDDGKPIVIPPGGSFTVRRKVFPAADLFAVKAIAGQVLGMPQRHPRLEVTAPDGPVAGAVVTARQGNAIYAMGKTDENGALAFDLPSGAYELRVEAFGRQDASLNIDTEIRTDYQIACGPAGYVTAEIRNAKGEPIPCKVAFRGVEGTPDPFFFPETGEHLARNLYYTHTGAFRQILPPGKYEAIVTYGPEYNAVRRMLEIAPGRGTPLQATLTRQVQTPGWISADLQNHSTVSGEASISYAEGDYTLDPVVDGNSNANQLGRVLNLLCEQIEFAPPTEHNMISSYAPLLAQLGATHLMATCPGVGLTASRRHALTHLNTFPVILKQGAQDGGALQRAEHTDQLTWLRKWDNGADKLIVVNKPECITLQVRREMDAFDVQALEPIVEGKEIPGADNRILTWLGMLTEGYRLPAVVNSGAMHNFHGSGGARNYIKVPTDDPAKIDPLDVVHAVRRGNVVMTTGPFLEVTLQDATAAAKAPAIPGDQVVVRGKKVLLHVRVQCPDWIDVDRIQVLANGKPAVAFTRAEMPTRFGDGVMKFDQQIPLTLAEDTFLIVVASGSGPNSRARQRPDDNLAKHVAVTNPIYVDIDGNGFEPISPLDYRVQSKLYFVQPVLATPGAAPGRIDLILKNTGTTVAKDTVELRVDPPGSARIVGDARRAYEIAPGKQATLAFQVAMTDEYLRRDFPVVSLNYINPRFNDIGFLVSRSSTGAGRTPAFLGLQVEHTVGSVPTLPSTAEVKAALADEVVYPVRARTKNVLANMRFAVAGDRLAVFGQVNDPNMRQGEVVWQGSCVVLFGAMPRQAIGQLFLVPQVGDAPARAYRRMEGKIVPAPEIQVTSQATAPGYEIQALIPLSLLAIDVNRMETTLAYDDGMALFSLLGLQPEGGRFLLECRVTTVSADDRLTTGTIFRSGAPHVDNLQFGHMRVESRVQCRLDILRPLSAAPAAGPARLRLHVKNISGVTVADRVVLEVDFPDSARFVGGNELAIALAPGEDAVKEFELALTGEATPGSIEIIAGRTPAIARTDLLTVEVADRMMPSLPGPLSLEQVAETLATQPPYLMKIGANVLAEARVAVAGDNLALDITVTDARVAQTPVPWKGSCVEIFGAMPGEKAGIGQIFLAPRVGAMPAAAFRSENGEMAPLPRVGVQSARTDAGYRLQALIPLTLLKVEPRATQFLLEIQADTRLPDGKTVSPTIFGSVRAYQETRKYGRMRVTRSKP